MAEEDKRHNIISFCCSFVILSVVNCFPSQQTKGTSRKRTPMAANMIASGLATEGTDLVSISSLVAASTLANGSVKGGFAIPLLFIEVCEEGRCSLPQQQD
eukprot:Trichotokara_eunicae@DN696_c0_g1_i1.p1